ncbi:hypothetical protein CYLTODRAFT_452303 [Cylindrobasidium torrendii FP15055 ss-10]|uniref:Uncharacterized protein n=1 Tax=Cylindrobasidium torrendii FP15055 ss-10 TaxID=1314674 RepID=A0A0D7BJK6_9AGAR|nr:hypothetical protein CYLTODRAFT_452303 [Cylindrobasidium torrendii FP15055 ss-10]
MDVVLRTAGSVAFSPFSEYQPTKPFSRRWIGTSILTCSIIALFGLAMFNVYTQGHELITSTIVSQTFYSENNPLRNGTSTTSCQSSLLDVSSSYYTRTSTSRQNGTSVVNPGSFKWTVNAFNPDGKLDTVQAAYNGEEMSCNVTSFGLTHHFAGNYFMFGVCAKCRMLDHKDETYGGSAKIDVLDMCSHFNQQLDDWPSYATDSLISQISQRDTNIGTFYDQLNFQPGALPDSVFPWGSNHTSEDTTVTPALIEYVNIWLAGFNYYSTSESFSLLDGEYGECGLRYCPQNEYRLDNETSSEQGHTDLSQLLKTNTSGSVLPVLGIGNLQPSLANGGDVSQLPGVLPQMYNEIFSVAAYMLDAALVDLTHRSIATSFICTVQTEESKKGWMMISVVVGSTLAVFGAIRTALITLGAFIDEELISRNAARDPPPSLHAPAPPTETREPLSPFDDENYAKESPV